MYLASTKNWEMYEKIPPQALENFIISVQV